MRELADSSLIANTGSIIMLISWGSIFCENVALSICLASLGRNCTTANLMRQILSLASCKMAGTIFSYRAAESSMLTRGVRFSIKETTTSVELFFRRIETIGIR